MTISMNYRSDWNSERGRGRLEGWPGAGVHVYNFGLCPKAVGKPGHDCFRFSFLKKSFLKLFNFKYFQTLKKFKK